MNVDWSILIACGGFASAEAVPSAIDVLFFGSPEDRQKAYWQIDNYVVVQGGLFESAPYATWLIADKLKKHPEKLNLELLDILFELGNGSALGKAVEHGPLQGKSIEQSCRDALMEVIPIIAAARFTLGERERATIGNILETLEASPE